MSFIELAKNRYSVRKFIDKPLDESVINSILQAGLIAPTGCNNQPIKILVLNTSESIAKLRSCTRCHFDCPTAMLVCYNKDECWHRPYDGMPCGSMDASIVTTHLMLQATDLGIGTTWVMHFKPDAIRESFAIPDNFEPVALLVMGYPSPEAKPFPGHLEKKQQDKIVVYEHF